MLKSGQCVYCGAPAGGAQRKPNEAQLKLVQAEVLLVPREGTKPAWAKWVFRIVAAVGGLALGIFALGPCMKG
jgi:hypothetical protein